MAFFHSYVTNYQMVRFFTKRWERSVFLLKTCVIMCSSSQVVTFWVGAPSTIQVNLFQDLDGPLKYLGIIKPHSQDTWGDWWVSSRKDIAGKHAWSISFCWNFVLPATRSKTNRGLVAFPNHHLSDLRHHTKFWLLLILIRFIWTGHLLEFRDQTSKNCTAGW